MFRDQIEQDSTLLLAESHKVTSFRKVRSLRIDCIRLYHGSDEMSRRGRAIGLKFVRYVNGEGNIAKNCVSWYNTCL